MWLTSSLAISLWLAAASVDTLAYLGDGHAVDPELGLVMTAATTHEGDLIAYERPVVLIPTELTPGEVHSTLRRFVLRSASEEKKDVGSHYFEAELLGSEALEGYPDCLKIRRHALRMDFSGARSGEDVVEWYARDRGLVRAEGERFWKDASGRVLRTETIDESR